MITTSELCRRALKIFDEAWRTDPTFTDEKEFHSIRVENQIKEQYSIRFFFPASALELPLESFANQWLYTAVNRLIDRMPAISTLDLAPAASRLAVVSYLCVVEELYGVRMRLTIEEQPILSLAVPGDWGRWERIYNSVRDVNEHRHVGTVMRIDVRATRKAAGE